MLNQLINSLPATGNHRLSARHGFQIHASETLVSAGQHEYGAGSHGLRYFRTALPSDKLDLAPNAQFADQRFQSGAVRSLSDDAASKLGKRRTEISNCPQNKFLPFARQQVADNENLRIGRRDRRRIRRKKTRIYAVVHDHAAGFIGRTGFQNFLHLAADTYCGLRRAVDVLRNLAPPGCRNSIDEAGVKHIQSVNRNHERNLQTPGNERSRVPAGEGGVSVDHIDRFLVVHLSYSSEETGVEQIPCTREPEISGDSRISHPFCRSRQTRLFSRIVNRGHGNHAGIDTELPKLFDRFRDEATVHLVLV